MLWHERIFAPKEPVARRLYEVHCRCHNLRFEERAGEFILLARLTVKGSRSESNKSVVSTWDDVLNVRVVDRIRPEAQ